MTTNILIDLSEYLKETDIFKLLLPIIDKYIRYIFKTNKEFIPKPQSIGTSLAAISWGALCTILLRFFSGSGRWLWYRFDALIPSRTCFWQLREREKCRGSPPNSQNSLTYDCYFTEFVLLFFPAQKMYRESGKYK